MGDHGDKAAALDTEAGFLDKFRLDVVGKLQHDILRLAQGQRIFQIIEEKFVQIVLTAGKEQKVDILILQPCLQSGERCPDRTVVRIEAALDQVRRAIDTGETCFSQGRRHFHGLVHGGRAVVQAGEKMAVPVIGYHFFFLKEMILFQKEAFPGGLVRSSSE